MDMWDRLVMSCCQVSRCCGRWGLGPEQSAKQQWFADTAPWTALSPLISSGLTRRMLNGVRIFVGQSATYSSCEVRINGIPHEPSTTALAAMDWPRTEQMTAAKVFLLLVHPEGTTSGQE
jgi:uncharacterized protein DUF6348